MLSEVNVFRNSETKLGKEKSLGPMICDDSLKFNSDEMKILSRGPKFMVRNELDLEDFNVELEKMLFKQRFDEMDQGKDDCLTVSQRDQEAFSAAESTNRTRLDNSNLNVKVNGSFAWEENVGNMVYNGKSRSLDLGNLKATNYKHNKVVYMPKNYNAEKESIHANRKNEMLRTFNRVANEGVNDSNLSKSEISGLKSLKNRIQTGNLVVSETDKSNRFALLTREQYHQSGLKHTKNDFELSECQVKRIQNSVNSHTWWFSEIFNCGSNWNHSDRMEKNLSDKGEQACAMQLLIKDHKNWHQSSGTPPPSRPVVSGNSGLNRHLSEMISLVIEPVASEADGFEVDSTGEMLAKIDELNDKLSNGLPNPNPELLGFVKEPSCVKEMDSQGIQDKEVLGFVKAPSCVETNICPNVDSNSPTRPKMMKNDIRAYGKIGLKTKVKPEAEILMDQVEATRIDKPKVGVLPNLADRIKAGKLIDRICKNKAIPVKGNDRTKFSQKPRQKPGKLAIVGADVVSLFPSLRNIETARLTRHAILDSKVDFCNVDYHKALRYISIVGGKDLLVKSGLGRLAPKWLGERQDLIAVGGKKSKDASNWHDSVLDMFSIEKKRIIATVLEIAVSVVMSSHVYKFMGHYYLQRDGGPIGLRSTASLANLIMKLWDMAWTKLLANEGIDWLLYYRYVDDNRTFLLPLAEGWVWTENGFEFNPIQEEIDLNSGESDQKRTTRELVKAMSSLVPFLKFEGEDHELYDDKTLPTLDTSIWWTGSKVAYKFFEKPTCPNRTLQKDSALSQDCIRSSLTQEVVRRLLNCSLDLPVVEKQSMLSKFAQKMINSGHSVASTQIILVHGVTKFNEIVRRSALPVTDPLYQPVHYDKNHKKYERKLRKFLAKSSWYSCGETVPGKTSWRASLPSEWRGSKPVQRKVHGVNFTTVLHVPSSSGGRLLKALANIEPR